MGENFNYICVQFLVHDHDFGADSLPPCFWRTLSHSLIKLLINGGKVFLRSTLKSLYRISFIRIFTRPFSSSSLFYHFLPLFPHYPAIAIFPPIHQVFRSLYYLFHLSINFCFLLSSLSQLSQLFPFFFIIYLSLFPFTFFIYFPFPFIGCYPLLT